jgi:2-desacetyl-2-hydroxyethyl bacteriochlorophyllide A dehydrogenase
VSVAGASTMRAAVLREHGGPEAFEYAEIERREPGEDEILVRVLACALNHLDIFVRRGMPGVPLPLPHVAGGDVAGRVVKAGGADGEHLVGAAVLLDPMVGRHALGENLWGGLAEYVVAPADNAIVLSGDGDGLERYAALPIAYGTARRMLVERARVQAGETVVVLGAAGGVGVACVQLGSRLGARVIACSSSEEKLGRLSELGAETTVDTRGDWGSEVWQLTGKRGADVVIDYIGRETWPTSIRCTRRGGRLVTCGATTGYEATTDLRYVWTRELDILGSDGWRRPDLEILVGLVDTHELEPVIHATFPLSHVRDAVAELEERRAFGKVIVVPDAEAA